MTLFFESEIKYIGLRSQLSIFYRSRLNCQFKIILLDREGSSGVRMHANTLKCAAIEITVNMY